MTNNERIAELKAQRDEISRHIRRLKTEGVVEHGPAKIRPRQPSTRDELWTLSYSVPLVTHFSKSEFMDKTLCIGTRKEVIAAIPVIIDNLRGLYNAAVSQDKEAKS